MSFKKASSLITAVRIMFTLIPVTIVITMLRIMITDETTDEETILLVIGALVTAGTVLYIDLCPSATEIIIKQLRRGYIGYITLAYILLLACIASYVFFITGYIILVWLVIYYLTYIFNS